MNKLHLQFPYKMALTKSPRQRFLLTIGHIFIALNGFSYFTGAVPIPGIVMALIAFIIASMRKNIFSIEIIKFSFSRLIFAALLIISIYAISFETGKKISDLWLVLIFIQLPISINDAWHVYSGKKGNTIL